MPTAGRSTGRIGTCPLREGPAALPWVRSGRSRSTTSRGTRWPTRSTVSRSGAGTRCGTTPTVRPISTCGTGPRAGAGGHPAPVPVRGHARRDHASVRAAHGEPGRTVEPAAAPAGGTDAVTDSADGHGPAPGRCGTGAGRAARAAGSPVLRPSAITLYGHAGGPSAPGVRGRRRSVRPSGRRPYPSTNHRSIPKGPPGAEESRPRRTWPREGTTSVTPARLPRWRALVARQASTMTVNPP